MVEAAAFPLPLLIRHAERRPQRETTWTRLAVAAEAAVLAPATRRRAARLTTPLEIAQRRSASLTTATDAALRTHTLAARAALHGREDWTDEVLGEALAVVQEASARVLGQRPYDVQLLGAHAALRGMAAEMATGEGKTLAAGIAASIAALAGIPVHLVTVNPYLAERDAAAMTPLYSFLGLSCGIAAEGVPLAKRQDAYRCDITVCTGKDLAFDYMRDRLRSGRRVGELRSRIDTLARRVDRPGPSLLRGLHFAIVDEADSVLIDEARTPLILARDAPDERDPTVYDRALELAAKCRLGV